MTSTHELLAGYRASQSDEARRAKTTQIVRLADADDGALDALYYVLNEENDSGIRLEVVKYLESRRPASGIRALTKEMFDPDPIVRAHAALGLAGYADARKLALSLSALLDALPDPATRTPADRAVRAITGRPPAKITLSERERLRKGEHPETIWPDHFATLP